MKVKLIIVFFFILILSSCSFYNRMTSPEVLEKEEHIVTFGTVSDPAIFSGEPGSIYAFQPVIGYRSGMGSNQEIGISLYGIWTPGLVLDYKHQILKRGNFLLSSDVAAFGGFGRPIGLQYDLLFGNHKLYGTIGSNYEFNNSPGRFTYVVGLGKEFGKKRQIGLQVTYARTSSASISVTSEYVENFISLGLKYDLRRIKKKYRTPK